jgi:hypothetical protein
LKAKRLRAERWEIIFLSGIFLPSIRPRGVSMSACGQDVSRRLRKNKNTKAQPGGAAKERQAPQWRAQRRACCRSSLAFAFGKSIYQPMKAKTRIAIVVLIFFAASIGYWFGYQHGSTTTGGRLNVASSKREIGLSFRQNRNDVTAPFRVSAGQGRTGSVPIIVLPPIDFRMPGSRVITPPEQLDPLSQQKPNTDLIDNRHQPVQKPNE